MDNTPDTTSSLAERVALLTRLVARQRNDYQDLETKLVARIGDVDDDRRLTSNRMQRALQTHHDEIEARLRKQAAIFAAILILITLLIGLASFYAYSRLDEARQELITTRAQLGGDDERLAAISAQNAAIEASLAGLRGSIALLSQSIERLKTVPPAPSEREDAAPESPDLQTPSTDTANILSGREPLLSPPADDLEDQRVETAPPADPQRTAEEARPAPAEDGSTASGTLSTEPPGTAATPERPTPFTAPPDQDADPTAPVAATARDAVEQALEEPEPTEAPARPDEDSVEPDPETPTREPAAPTPPPDTAAAVPESATSALVPPADTTTTESDISDSDPSESDTIEEQRDAPAIVAPSTPEVAPERPGADTSEPPHARIMEELQQVGNDNHALQLIGFHSLDSLLDFAQREALPERVYFREESFQGRPWYVLIHSLHPARAAAVGAQEELPDTLALLDLWIRPLPPETQLGIIEITR
ncbi:hypothetical protein CKO25_04860 [Thiocapsa imhoffii]|uniref:SPOR domain-containing protein n=1 Tax=Thiocapsa imhoffii TaxID=382777 RepID=A0A9X0WFY7_9GAMM|nr:hypothetical protein [Thiocapsa imhoffii]MBK1643996.1 hypothetical protein [Thiocapsa imhoffii]